MATAAAACQRKGHQQWNQGDRVQAGPAPTTTDHHWPAQRRKRRIYSTFHLTELTSEICLLPVSYERLSTILTLRRQKELTALRYADLARDQRHRGIRLTGVGLYPGPGLFRWAIWVPTRTRGC